MHIADFRLASLEQTAFVAGGFPIAVGAGSPASFEKRISWLPALRGRRIKPGAPFTRPSNMASIWKLPVLLSAEITSSPSTTPFSYSTSVRAFRSGAEGYDSGRVSMEIESWT